MAAIPMNELLLFSVNGHALPDPASYDYTSQSLDTSAERDTAGLLHRKMVATKFNVALKWNGLSYTKVQQILSWVKGQEFIFAFPCPEEEITESNPYGLHTGKYYCGDRKVSLLKAMYPDDKSKWVCSLQFDLIEY